MTRNQIWIAVGAFLLLFFGVRLLGSRGLLYAVVLIICYGLISQWVDHARAMKRAPSTPAPRAPRAPSEGQKRWERYRAEIAALSLEEARLRAEPTFGERGDWVPDAAAPEGRLTQDLAPGLRELLVRTGSLRARYGSARIGGDFVKRFDWPGGDVLQFGQSASSRAARFRQVGLDADENPLVAKPGEETLYVLRKSEANPSRWWSSDYPSIYHWMLMQQYRDG